MASQVKGCALTTSRKDWHSCWHLWHFKGGIEQNNYARHRDKTMHTFHSRV